MNNYDKSYGYDNNPKDEKDDDNFNIGFLLLVIATSALLMWAIN